MSGVRLALLALLACLCLASAAQADIPGPDGRATRHPWGYGAPPPGWFEREEAMRKQREANPGGTEQEPPPVVQEPRRSGPFRSCGSGMGLGLAGIGMAWGFMWVGNRYAGRVAGERTGGDKRDR
jgi:hypothetical protein